MGDDSIVRFMRMAAPEDENTWFSVHRRILYTDGRPPIFPGSAHKTVRTAIKDALYWSSHGHCVYLSQGMFRTHGEKKYGIYPPADRSYPNLVSCKNLYMDVDVKEDGGYASTAEASKATLGFINSNGLPRPTIIVGSGSGGFHLYWTIAEAFDLTTFLNMAGRLINAGLQHGLKFDVQCTRDATRLLRVAGTWNFKYATTEIPATPVSLFYCGKDHIILQDMEGGLAQYPATTPSITHQSKLHSIGGVDQHGLPLSELDDITGGMKGDYPPVSIDEVAKNCPFIFNTLEDHGASLVSDPQWHLAAALACHCEEPSATVHRLCSGNQYYSFEGTEEKLAIAQRAREQRDTIGPPKCSYISQHRPECKACPNLARDTTPLALGFTKSVPQPLPSAAGAAAPNDIPAPYFRGMDKLIYRRKVDDGGANISEVAFPYQIIPYSAHIEGGDEMKFVFSTVQGEKEVIKRIECGKIANVAPFSEAMHGTALPLDNPKTARDFMSFYMQQLQHHDATMITIPPFGWSLDSKGQMGFSFAGEFVSPNGRIKCQQPEQGTENYRVTGSDQVWRDLVNIIVTPDRPDVSCMVASSFGAPLINLSGQQGLLLGVISPASGIGKSTALLAGQAVWSSPVVGGMTDTPTYTFSKLATLKHLPVFYDEIKGEKQIAAMTILAFQLTGGHEKGRADRTGKMREVKEFRTLLGYAANGSIVHSVREEDKGTDASWLRMFEMQAIVIKTNKHNYAAKVNTLLTELNHNHGGIGREYATFLGESHDKIKRDLSDLQVKLAEFLGADPKVERFWVTAMATTLLGAMYANQLGFTNFPLKKMREYMFGQYHRMKQEMADDPGDYTQDAAFLNTLGMFLNDKFPRNLVLLDKTWTLPTRPTKGYARILNTKPNDASWGTLEVQISGDPLVLRITDKSLTEWCKLKGRPKQGFIQQLKDKLKATIGCKVIGSGSARGGAPENVWTINAKGTIIEHTLEFAINNAFLPS